MKHPKHLSFEFYPPKDAEAERALLENWQILNQFRPDFYSVTFGAGGSTQEKTAQTVYTLRESFATNAIPHLSCIGLNQATIENLLHAYQNKDIKELVVLRGDYPSGQPTTSDFRFAEQLVDFVRKKTGDHFHLYVAAYPEYHPEAHSAEFDLHNFKRKVEAGANTALTQYFYNQDAYFYFLESCAKKGITIPIIPGIMPITNFTGLVRFSKRCGAEIPLWIYKRLENFRDPASIKKFGIEVVTRLCESLLKGGAPGLHFYTLNKADPTREICQNLFDHKD